MSSAVSRRPLAFQSRAAKAGLRRGPSWLFDVFTLLAISNQMFPFVFVCNLSLLEQEYYAGGGAVPTEPGLAQYAIYVAILARALVSVAARPRLVSSMLTQGWLITSYVAAATLSVVWASNPSYVVPKVGYFVLVNCVALSLMSRHSRSELLRLLTHAFVAIVVTNLAFAIVAPEVASVTYRTGVAFRGYYEHKSGLGTALGVLGPVAIRTLKPKASSSIVGVLVVVLLILSESALGMVALAIGSVGYFSLRYASRLTSSTRQAPWVGLVFSSLVLLVPLAVGFESLVGVLGRDVTLTGRTLIWARVWSVGAEGLPLGHGFKGFFGLTKPLVYGLDQTPIPHPHNAALASFVDLGVFSLLLVAVLVVLLYRMWQTASRCDGTHAKILVGIGLSLIALSLVESSLVYGPGLLWTLLWMCFVGPVAGPNHSTGAPEPRATIKDCEVAAAWLPEVVLPDSSHADHLPAWKQGRV